VPIELGVILPTSTPDPAQPILGDVRASACFAEELGLESVWATDHLIASAPMLESTAVLATAAAVTERMGIGYGVMLLALRPPAWAAKQVATLQYVSGDRLLLGVGTGNPAHGDVGWVAAGVPFRERGQRTDQALRVLPDLIAGRSVLLDGAEITLAPGAAIPPVLVAGNGSRALRRAAEYGDGWLSVGLSPKEAATGLKQLGELAAERGRPTPAATVVGPVLHPDPARTADELADYAAAGVQRLIVVPTTAGWQRDYEFAATLQPR
jgi:alkanesulfonate monooxygenase SsuD/methylene tetrahydromethanopterin reductase-like flavin-dependent oxidoreductase (luciferase family)